MISVVNRTRSLRSLSSDLLVSDHSFTVSDVSVALFLLLLDMSSVYSGLDFKDAESLFESCSASRSNICYNVSKHISCVGSEDVQDSDGDDNDNILQNVTEESKDKAIRKPIPESLESLDDENEDENLATALQDMFSESKSVVPLIPAIKGGREKHGKALEKLSVSWAQDVYDPPPSIVSHTKKQQPQKPKAKNNLKKKKNGKKGQKGSNKDKKQSSSSRTSKYNNDKFDWTAQLSIITESAA